MEIKGKITIFPEKKSNDKGEFVVCKGTISSKTQDGKYLNKSVEVKFSNEKFPKEKVNSLDPTKCYQLEVKSGYLVVDGYEKEGKMHTFINLYVLDGKLTGSKEVVRPEEAEITDSDLPF